MRSKTKILLADDHPMILQGTKAFLEENNYVVSNMCSKGDEALLCIERYLPDIAILDISMPQLSGIEVARTVMENKLPCKIILLTMHNEHNVFKKAMDYGVYGYLLKNLSSDEILICLEKVINGEKYFSPHLNDELTKRQSDKEIEKLGVTEKKIVEYIAKNKNSKQIGELLFLSERTIEWHRRNIIEKLNLPKEKNALLAWAFENFKNNA